MYWPKCLYLSSSTHSLNEVHHCIISAFYLCYVALNAVWERTVASVIVERAYSRDVLGVERVLEVKSCLSILSEASSSNGDKCKHIKRARQSSSLSLLTITWITNQMCSAFIFLLAIFLFCSTQTTIIKRHKPVMSCSHSCASSGPRYVTCRLLMTSQARYVTSPIIIFMLLFI